MLFEGQVPPILVELESSEKALWPSVATFNASARARKGLFSLSKINPFVLDFEVVQRSLSCADFITLQFLELFSVTDFQSVDGSSANGTS